jgi:hypothetical protein
MSYSQVYGIEFTSVWKKVDYPEHWTSPNIQFHYLDDEASTVKGWFFSDGFWRLKARRAFKNRPSAADNTPFEADIWKHWNFETDLIFQRDADGFIGVLAKENPFEGKATDHYFMFGKTFAGKLLQGVYVGLTEYGEFIAEDVWLDGFRLKLVR